MLTVLFVMLAELVILAPSLASYEDQRLKERVRAGELASLAVEASPDQVVTDTLHSQLRNGAGVVSVAVQSDGIRRLLLQGPRLARTPKLVDLRTRGPVGWLLQPFQILTGSPQERLRIVAKPSFRDGDFVEIVAPVARLKRELVGYLLGLIEVTAFIGAVAGLLVYLSLNLFLVRPMQRITASMERFRANPDDVAARVPPSHRRDEIGRAEGELDRMQADLRAALKSRARLAALGEAVAKINHDLRNMLTSAQIASERLALSGDPSVAAALPRLERALDRAAALASNVLEYGKSEERPPEPAVIPLLAAVEAAAEDAGLSRAGRAPGDPPGGRGRRPGRSGAGAQGAGEPAAQRPRGDPGRRVRRRRVERHRGDRSLGQPRRGAGDPAPGRQRPRPAPPRPGQPVPTLHRLRPARGHGPRPSHLPRTGPGQPRRPGPGRQQRRRGGVRAQPAGGLVSELNRDLSRLLALPFRCRSRGRSRSI